MLTLFLEAVLVVVAGAIYAETRETPNVRDFGPALAFLPFTLMLGAVIGCWLTFTATLPTVWLSGVLGRRFGGRERWWWVLPAAAAVTLVPLAPRVALGAGRVSLFDAVGWLSFTAVISGAALTSRSRTRHLFRKVAAWGTVAAVVTAGAGGAALWTGVLTEYRPPALTPEALVGTWSDGHGGTLRFAADGTVTASGVDAGSLDGDSSRDSTAPCAGQGTWTYSPGRSTWSQAVEVSVADCAWDAWNVGGHIGRTTLYQYVGDPDSWELYELRKADGRAPGIRRR